MKSQLINLQYGLNHDEKDEFNFYCNVFVNSIVIFVKKIVFQLTDISLSWTPWQLCSWTARSRRVWKKIQIVREIESIYTFSFRRLFGVVFHNLEMILRNPLCLKFRHLYSSHGEHQTVWVSSPSGHVANPVASHSSDCEVWAPS